MNIKKLALSVVITLVISLCLVGCNKKKASNEHPTNEHPTKEHPSGSDEHPSGD